MDQQHHGNHAFMGGADHLQHHQQAEAMSHFLPPPQQQQWGTYHHPPQQVPYEPVPYVHQSVINDYRPYPLLPNGEPPSCYLQLPPYYQSMMQPPPINNNNDPYLAPPHHQPYFPAQDDFYPGLAPPNDLFFPPYPPQLMQMQPPDCAYQQPMAADWQQQPLPPAAMQPMLQMPQQQLLQPAAETAAVVAAAKPAAPAVAKRPTRKRRASAAALAAAADAAIQKDLQRVRKSLHRQYQELKGQRATTTQMHKPYAGSGNNQTAKRPRPRNTKNKTGMPTLSDETTSQADPVTAKPQPSQPTAAQLQPFATNSAYTTLRSLLDRPALPLPNDMVDPLSAAAMHTAATVVSSIEARRAVAASRKRASAQSSTAGGEPQKPGMRAVVNEQGVPENKLFMLVHHCNTNDPEHSEDGRLLTVDDIQRDQKRDDIFSLAFASQTAPLEMVNFRIKKPDGFMAAPSSQ